MTLKVDRHVIPMVFRICGKQRTRSCKVDAAKFQLVLVRPEK
jgi:hypothetical protein